MIIKLFHSWADRALCLWVNLHLVRFGLIIKSVVAVTKYPLKPAHANTVHMQSLFIYLSNRVLEIKPTRANGTSVNQYNQSS